jgi:hypothetical protein
MLTLRRAMMKVSANGGWHAHRKPTRVAVTIEALKCARTSAGWWKQKHQRPVADRTMFDRAKWTAFESRAAAFRRPIPRASKLKAAIKGLSNRVGDRAAGAQHSIAFRMGDVVPWPT